MKIVCDAAFFFQENNTRLNFCGACVCSDQNRNNNRVQVPQIIILCFTLFPAVTELSQDIISKCVMQWLVYMIHEMQRAV